MRCLSGWQRHHSSFTLLGQYSSCHPPLGLASSSSLNTSPFLFLSIRAFLFPFFCFIFNLGQCRGRLLMLPLMLTFGGFGLSAGGRAGFCDPRIMGFGYQAGELSLLKVAWSLKTRNLLWTYLDTVKCVQQMGALKSQIKQTRGLHWGTQRCF